MINTNDTMLKTEVPSERHPHLDQYDVTDLVEALVEAEVVLGQAVAERWPIGARKLQQIRQHRRVDGDLAGRQASGPRIIVAWPPTAATAARTREEPPSPTGVSASHTSPPAQS